MSKAQNLEILDGWEDAAMRQLKIRPLMLIAARDPGDPTTNLGIFVDDDRLTNAQAKELLRYVLTLPEIAGEKGG